MLQWIYNYRAQLKICAVPLAGIAVVFCISFFVTGALAQTIPDPNAASEGINTLAEPLGLPTTDIRLIIANIIRVALGLLGIIFLVLLLYGGYLWMTAGGNEEQVGSAKKILLNSIIGLLIILSAYGIVIFVMRMLGIGQGGEGFGGEGLGAPQEQNFQGSGMLGGIIKDHYPSRNQVDVARNTKIVITFRRPVKADSIAADKNANGKFGDCVNIGQSMKWETDCDTLILNQTHLNIIRSDTKEPIRGAAVLASLENGKVFTIVVRPYDPLGNSTDKVPYTVRVGKDVLLDDSAGGNPSVFSGRPSGSDYYEWQFTADTALDTVPPHVNSVFPGKGVTEAKNSVIQVDFSEPMDPTGVQGVFGKDQNGAYYILNGNNIFLKSGASTIPLGNFRLTNGYRTLEFTPTAECGRNACGGKVYCMPVCDDGDAKCKEDTYELLLKAGQTFTAASFEAVPFSGIMDLSSNALDGNENRKVDLAGTTGDVFTDQKKPDNYFWNFKLKDELDITAPYLKQVSPGLDAGFVAAKDPWTMLFSKRMRVDPMYDIDIQEQPASTEPLCKAPRVDFNLNGTTLTSMEHCPFLDNNRHYYYPNLDSRVEDVHFNCFYPAKGPLGVGQDNQSLICDDAHPENCCAATSDPQTKAFCCNGFTNLSSRQSCLSDLRANSP